MIFKSSMRRGISLEVIVEEDDNAEVSLDPHMRIYDNNIDLSSNSSSTSSCSGNEEREEWNSENENKDNYERLKAEKEKWRQKRETDERWRRLGKQRSLSCETLTILDVGDDNISQEQWEEEARDWDLEEENHIDQSISRKRILRSTMDLEEEEHVLVHETRSNSYEKNVDEQEELCVDDDEIYDSKIDFDEEESEQEEEKEDIRMEENEKESYREKKENSNLYEPFTEVDLIPENELSIGPVLKSFQDPWLQDPFSLESDTWITVGELTGDIENNSKLIESPKKQKEVTFSDDIKILESYTPSDVSDLSLPSSEELKTHDQKIPETPSAATFKEPGVYAESFSDVIKEPLPPIKAVKDIFDNNRNRNVRNNILHKLETAKSPPLIKVVEKQNFKQTSSERKKLSDPAESKSIKKAGTHNKEVHLEELPAPHTVSSVRQLFEILPGPISNFHNTHSLGRFDHVRSNPTSKILRFDRDRHSAQKSTTPSLSSEKSPKGEILSSINDGSRSLRRTVKTGSPVESAPVKNCQLSSSRITMSRRATISLRPSQDMSTTGIFLRKPKIMSRFNVKKALEENPRYFHIRREDRLKEGSHKDANKIISKECDPPERTQSHHSQSQEQRDIHNLISPGRLHWLRDTIDRSDAESLSSDSSEDSGVTKDFNSSILSKFSSSSQNKAKNNWHQPNDSRFSSDPSFKWIDPAVLAKIRAVGTTVIYFGPRHQRPNTKGSNFTSSLIREEKSIEKNPTKEMKEEFILKSREEPNKRTIEERHNSINTAKQYKQVPPRIVGVLRKTNGNSEEATKDSERKINTIKKDSSLQIAKSTSRMTNGENKTTMKQPEVISVVYDFTRK